MSQHPLQPEIGSHPTAGLYDPSVVQEALERIMRSAPFRTTRQCQNMLRYVVENTLSGQDSALRERVIGAEVFGRTPDYDTSEDPVVRIRAAEIRKRLAQYYQSCLGERISVRIDLPPGSYRAAFEWMIEDPGTTDTIAPILSTSSDERASEEVSRTNLSWQSIAPATAQLQNQKHESSWQSRWILLSALLLLFVGLSVSALWPTTHSNFDRFWSPMSSKSKPVLICMGSNIVYELSHEYMVRYLQDHRLSEQSLSSFVDLPPDASILGRDLQPAHNSFVALGDVAAVSDVVATLTKQGRSFQQRFPPDISFAELKDTPTILVGGFNNPLTIALTKDLRFVLSQSSRIEDRQKPGKFWSVEFHGDARDTEDYAVVSRLINSSSGGPVISIAGIGQYGTQAAAEFVGNPEMITKLLKNAPRGWSTKNMQVVLHVKILDFRPVSTDIVGISFW